MTKKPTYEELERRLIELENESQKREMAETALRESQQAAADLIQYLPYGIFIYQYEKPDRLILIDGNSTAEKMTGIKIEEERGKELNDIWPSARELGRTDFYLNVYKSGKFDETKETLYKDQRFQGYFSISSFPIPGNKIVVAFEIITEKKKKTAELAKLKDLLERTEEMAQIGSWSLNVETGEPFLSQEIHRIYEIPLDYTPPVEDGIKFYAPECRPIVSEAVNSAIKDGTPYDIECELITAKGNRRWIRTLGRAVRIEGITVELYGALQDITERKQTEDELAKHRDQLENMVEERTSELKKANSKLEEEIADRTIAEKELQKTIEMKAIAEKLGNVGSWEWDFVSNKVTLSENAMQLYGIKPKDFDGNLSTIMNIIHPEDKDDIGKRLNEIQPSKTPTFYKYRIIKPDGDLRAFEGTTQMYADESGNISRIVGSIIDVSERKQFEKSLRESEERFRAIFEQAAVGVALIESSTGKFIRINQKYCEIVGYTKDEMLAKSFKEITHPDDLQSDMENMQQLMDGAINEFSIEKRYLCPDNSIIWVNLTVSPMWKSGENPTFHVAVVEDITNRKQVEEELRLNSEIMSNMTEGIYLIGLDDIRIVYTNPHFEKMFGYSPKEMIGKHASIVNAPTDKDPIKTANEIMDVINKTGEWHGEVENIKKDGTHFWCYANVSIFDHQQYGKVLISVHTDITTKKAIEIALAKNEEKYRTLFENINEGFCLNEIILDDNGVPVDYRFLEINPAFEAQTGLEYDKVIGKTVREILPGIENDPVNWIGRYGKVALTGEEMVIEDYSAPLDRWYLVHVFSPKKGFFAATFSDITDRKKMENEKELLISELKIAIEEVKTLKGFIPICASCKNIRDDKGYWSQIEEYISEHSEAKFSHGICPECIKKLYPDYYNENKENGSGE